MNYSNNAFSVLAAGITNVATTISLAPGTGSRFPAADFRVTLIGYDGLGNENAWEICHCSSRTGDVLTVTRGQEGTTAVAWASATRIENRLTAGSISGGIAYTRKTSAYTLTDKDGIIADTTGGSFTVNLPASPTAGMQCFIADGGDWSVNQLVVDPQGATIESLAVDENLNLNVGGIQVQFLHDGTKWNVHVTAAAFNGTGVTTAGAQTLTNKVIAFGSNTLTDVASTNTTQTLTNKTLTAPVITGATAEVVSLNGGQLAGLRNKIINGKMEIVQRGTSFVSPASATYNLDRWLIGIAGAGAVTVSQQADAPSDNEFQNSLRLAVTTADASIAAGDLLFLTQRIEGYNVRDLIGRTFTVSFRVRSSKTGIHCVALRNGGADRSYVVEYTVNAANTWETKSVTVPGGLITAGTWDWTTGVGLSVFFTAAAGSTFQTTAGSWQTGNFQATANQVNVFDTIGNIFAITGVQIEVGAVATPFEHRPIGLEKSLCERYYEKGTSYFYGVLVAGQTGNHGGTIQFKVEKRAIPTMTTASGTVDGVSVHGANQFFNIASTGQQYLSSAWTAASEL